ncbi:antitoxin [Mycobacterium talmoniae]|uniref:Antitoxin n=1 Tax=Mycobacterium talmoniae TaxID=1858794 RepID=A0A1S1MTL2_9MYCO|nr:MULTISPECIES: antitoxin [Mycobacterium]OHU90247.1 antitoxin [Mycobacterium talmoniae]PQM47252.1 Antitoxin MazE3 [Mycobacterium talmoniae]TDH46227.1 antitoxin [Mycobacterium eburneum]
MTTQIAVRLPDEIVAFVDREVSENRAASRAAVVLRALQREQRRQIAARDAAILAATEPDHDLDALAAHTAKQAADID